MIQSEMKNDYIYCAVLASLDTLIFCKVGKNWADPLVIDTVEQEGEPTRLKMRPLCRFNYVPEISPISHWQVLTIYEPESGVIGAYRQFLASWKGRMQQAVGTATVGKN